MVHNHSSTKNTCDHRSPLRVAVIGCGAISQAFHLPVLAGHPDVVLAALVDRNIAAVEPLARAYGVEAIAEDVSQLDPQSVDAALVATPPCYHEPITIELLKNGIHVLVEKPMAINAEEATRMIDMAEQSGKVLSAGYFRRLFPGSRVMKALLTHDVLGPPLRFDVQEGYFFDWPSATLGSMHKDSAGGGVLIDTGSHTIDQLLSFFDGPAELIQCRHDSLGGIEADCRVNLRIHHQGHMLEGCVQLSRIRNLPNRFQIECERATLELPVGERSSVSVIPKDVSLTDSYQEAVRDYEIRLGWTGTDSLDVAACFYEQIDDWVRAIHSGNPPYLSGQSILSTVKLIDTCYRHAEPLEQVWVHNAIPTIHHETPPAVHTTSQRRVLITGASGFIGCRMAEILALREGWGVRALVHRPASASRLARLPVEMMQADLLSSADIKRAVADCDAVVHCAYGTSFVRREAIRATVSGSRDLAQAALDAGVDRFVHLSTAAVYGTQIEGVIDESTPLRPDAYEYARSKSKAEQQIQRLIAAGLPGVVLRLVNVFGPFSGPYTIRPLAHLVSGVPVLVGEGEAPSNTVFVDHVVEAVVKSLSNPADDVVGQTFNVNDEEMTWAEFYGGYAQALGVEMQSVDLDRLQHLRAAKRQNPFGVFPRLWRNGIDLLHSAELKALAKKAIQSDPIGVVPRWAIHGVPGLRPLVHRLLKMDQPDIFIKASPEPSAQVDLDVDLLNIHACRALVSGEKARRVLGLSPTVSRTRAMELTIQWCSDAGLIN